MLSFKKIIFLIGIQAGELAQELNHINFTRVKRIGLFEKVHTTTTHKGNTLSVTLSGS
jgi:hypothetical protein